MLSKINAKRPKFSGIFKRFLKNSSGSLTPMMGLAAIPFFLAAGMAIDMSRVTREQTAFYGAVDGAALAIAADERSALDILGSDAAKESMRRKLEQYAQSYLEQNYRDVSGGEAKVNVDLSISGSDIKLDADIDFPMTVMRLAGIDKMSLKASSTIKKAMKPIELTMVLDTTGSMRDDMVALKTSANKLLATLYSDGAAKNMSSEYIRVSLVPFSGAVRLNTSAFDYDAGWIDTTGANPLSHINFTDPTWHNFMAWGRLMATSTAPQRWNGCVEARTHNYLGTNYITEDIEPDITNPASLFPAYFNPDSPSFYSTGSGNSANYPTNTSGSMATGSWNNNYINAYTGYAPTGTSNSSLLAPAGSRKTGFDDSAIGNVNAGTAGATGTVFQARFKNQAKYDGRVVGNETYTASGTSWSVNAGPWVNCTASAVVPMTYDRSKVEAGISAMKAYGGTNIAEGLAWGRRVLSPTAPFKRVEGFGSIAATTIAPYNGPRWQKILVLMTDGQNDPYVRTGSGTAVSRTDTGTSYNAFGYSLVPTTAGLNRYGSTTFANADDTLDSYTTSMCTKLKADGVTIYTVAYRVSSTLMSGCATSAAHYKQANDAVELAAFFDHIGQDVLNKMIYVSK
jgi:Flp pilus assembly protein TadG